MTNHKMNVITPEIPGGVHHRPAIRFPEFSDDWEEMRLREVAENIKSYSISRDKEVENSNLEYVHYGDIHRLLTKTHSIIDTRKKLPYIHIDKEVELLKSGDVVIADASEDYNGIANPLILEDIANRNIVAGLHTIAFRPNHQLNSLFCYYHLLIPIFKYYGYQIGTGMKVFGISKTNFFNYKLSLPSLPEQEKIGNFLSLVDKKLS